MSKKDFDWDVETWSEAKNTLETLSNEYMPSSGPASTVLGEMLRAINRICYRFFNDGDYAAYSYGVKTVAPSCAYLLDEAYVECDNAGVDVDTLTNFMDDVAYLFTHNPLVDSDDSYEGALERMVIDGIKAIGEGFDGLFTTANTANCVRYSLDVLKYMGIKVHPGDDWRGRGRRLFRHRGR